MWQNLDNLMPSLAVMSPGHAQSQVTQFKKMEVLLRNVHSGSQHLVLPWSLWDDDDDDDDDDNNDQSIK